MRGEPMMSSPPQAEEKTEVEPSDTPPADSANGSDGDILPGNDNDILAEEKDDSILPGNDDDILSDGTGSEVVAKTDERDSAPELPEPMDSELWAEAGGWYRQDFAVLYKPVGHRDGFMKAWLDYTGAQYGNDKVNLAAPIFDMMSARQAQGQCAKCHSIDSAIDNSRKVNWAPYKVLRSLEKFTKFSHEPHFGLFTDKGCTACHAINGQAKYRDTYKGLNPKIFQSNFKPVQQQQCSACHQTKAAGQSCSLCHVYHVDDVITPIMSTSVAKQ